MLFLKIIIQQVVLTVPNHSHYLQVPRPNFYQLALAMLTTLAQLQLQNIPSFHDDKLQL